MSRRPTRQPASMVKPVRANAPHWLRPGIVVLAALLLIGWFSTPVADSDTWWILKSGQYIVQHRALPVPDPFAFTAGLGKPSYPGEETTRYFNLTQEWLAEVVFYLVYAAAGFPGLILLRAVMLTAFSATAGLLVFHRTNGFYRALATTLATAFVASNFVSDRPYQFTFLFLAATLAILECRWRLWLLPPIFLVWANCHGGFILGYVVMGAYCAEAQWLRWRGNPPADERRLWMACAASFLVSGVNPNGFRPIAVLLAFRQSSMIGTLFEWQRPHAWPPNLMVLLLLAAAAVLVWKRAQTRPADWLLLGLFGAAYFSAVRNTPLVGLVAPVVIAIYLPWKKILPAAVDFLVAGLILVGIGAEMAQGRAFQLRAADWKYPSGAADFMLAHHVTGPMFNTWEKGGYLIWRLWPQERVFIDGRVLNESVFQDYQRIIRYSPATGGPSGRELLDRYGIQAIVMNGFEMNSGDPYVLPLILSDPAQTEWKLVFRDAGSFIFMRTPPPGVAPLPAYDVFASLEAQCEVSIANDPARPRCARGLGHLFARMGDVTRARRWMGLYLEQRTDQNPADDLLYRQLTGAR
jgi:hypothetical protein